MVGLTCYSTVIAVLAMWLAAFGVLPWWIPAYVCTSCAAISAAIFAGQLVGESDARKKIEKMLNRS